MPLNSLAVFQSGLRGATTVSTWFSNGITISSRHYPRGSKYPVIMVQGLHCRCMYSIRGPASSTFGYLDPLRKKQTLAHRTSTLSWNQTTPAYGKLFLNFRNTSDPRIDPNPNETSRPLTPGKSHYVALESQSPIWVGDVVTCSPGARNALEPLLKIMCSPLLWSYYL